MDSSWLDRLPSNERTKIRKRMRSEADYERLREKVKGPEDLEREMDRSKKLAELHFLMESEPEVQKALREQVQEDMRREGVEAVLENVSDLDADARKNLEQGKFVLKVSSHPRTKQDHLVAVPEGNVREKIPLSSAFSDRYVSQLTMQK